MEVLKIFVILWILIEVAFIFPTLHNACQNVDPSLSLSPLIKSFPYIFLVVFAVVPIYLAFKGNK